MVQTQEQADIRRRCVGGVNMSVLLLFESTRDKAASTLDGFPCDVVLWAESHKEDEFRQLIEFPVSETMMPYDGDQSIIREKIREFLKVYLPYHENQRIYSYNGHTPICYKKDRDITFLMAKPDTVMTRYTADKKEGIILFTDGDLFNDLLESYIFNCDEVNNYIKPKIYPDKETWKMAFSHYVLMKKGIAVYGGRVVHHNVHMRNNTSACIEVLSRREHIKYHANERKNGHYFNGKDYMMWIEENWGLKKDETKMLEHNLKFLIEAMPFFKGIEISDSLDLTGDISYLSNKDIWNYLTLY